MYVSLPNSRQYPQQYLSDLRSRRISEGVIPKRPRRLHVLEPSPVVLIARLSPLVYANYFQDSVDINNAHVLKTRPFHLYTLLVFVCDRLPWPPTRGRGAIPLSPHDQFLREISVETAARWLPSFQSCLFERDEFLIWLLFHFGDS